MAGRMAAVILDVKREKMGPDREPTETMRPLAGPPGKSLHRNERLEEVVGVRKSDVVCDGLVWSLRRMSSAHSWSFMSALIGPARVLEPS